MLTLCLRGSLALLVRNCFWRICTTRYLEAVALDFWFMHAAVWPRVSFNHAAWLASIVPLGISHGCVDVLSLSIHGYSSRSDYGFGVSMSITIGRSCMFYVVFAVFE